MDKKSFMQSEDLTGFIGLELRMPYRCHKLVLMLTGDEDLKFTYTSGGGEHRSTHHVHEAKELFC
jgi:hypothetical protein